MVVRLVDLYLRVLVLRHDIVHVIRIMRGQLSAWNCVSEAAST
jgi:hypothetical protein